MAEPSRTGMYAGEVTFNSRGIRWKAGGLWPDWQAFYRYKALFEAWDEQRMQKGRN